MGIIRDSFIIFKNWADAIDALPEEYQLETYKALTKYGTTGEIPEGLSPVANAMLISFSVGMEKSIVRYESSVQNGKLGGRPSKNKPNETQENLEKPNETQENLDEPTQNLNVNVNDNDKVIKEESVKEESGTSPLSTHTQKHKYGKYKNVLLTEEEYNHIIAESDGKEAIEHLSTYREMKGYKVKSDNLAIHKWVFNAVREERQQNAKYSQQQPIKPKSQSVSAEEAAVWK